MAKLNVGEALGGKENVGAMLSRKRGGGGAAGRAVALASPTKHSNNHLADLARGRDTGDSGSGSGSTAERETASAQYNSSTAGTPASLDTVAVSPWLVASSPVTPRRLLPFPGQCNTSTDANAAGATATVIPDLPYLSPVPPSPFASAVGPTTPATATAAATATPPPPPPQQHQHVQNSPSPRDPPPSSRRSIIIVEKRSGGTENDVPSSPPPVAATSIRAAAAAAGAVAAAVAYIGGGEGTPYSGTARRVAVRQERKQLPSPLCLTPSRLYDSTAAIRAGAWATPALSASSAGGSSAGGGDSVRHQAFLGARRRRLGMRCSSASKVGSLKGVFVVCVPRGRGACAWWCELLHKSRSYLAIDFFRFMIFF